MPARQLTVLPSRHTAAGVGGPINPGRSGRQAGQDCYASQTYNNRVEDSMHTAYTRMQPSCECRLCVRRTSMGVARNQAPNRFVRQTPACSTPPVHAAFFFSVNTRRRFTYCTLPAWPHVPPQPARGEVRALCYCWGLGFMVLGTSVLPGQARALHAVAAVQELT